ncbi:hypothetical protein BC826DRAFT_1108918 [Russula brevipes]|nr:hypothetical protein BC826DRAFT_1108918 [Russula brevipes]
MTPSPADHCPRKQGISRYHEPEPVNTTTLGVQAGSGTTVIFEALKYGGINMAMAGPPDLRLFWSLFVYARIAPLPAVVKHFVGKLARSRDTLRIVIRRIIRKSGDELAKRGEVSKKAPGHIGHDEIS